jgi:predicted DNA-binding transcriptional regulator AlpA
MDGDDLMTVEEAIGRLGVSRATFYNHARNLQRFRRVGDRRVLYRVSDIEAMAELQPVRQDTDEHPPIVYEPTGRKKARAKRRYAG